MVTRCLVRKDKVLALHQVVMEWVKVLVNAKKVRDQILAIEQVELLKKGGLVPTEDGVQEIEKRIAEAVAKEIERQREGETSARG